MEAQLRQTTPRPFEIHVEQSVLDDLQRRLLRTRWAPGIHPAKKDGWDHGTSSTYLQQFVEYWAGAYDWRREEERLNVLPQFTAPVEDARFHFVHSPSPRPNAMPLLLLHGWPDSFNRYHKMVPKLTAAGFDVVVPSLPGFPFTGPVPSTSNRHPNEHTAELLWKLMTQVLGYTRFAVAGGDGGSAIAQLLAIHHPASVIGLHLTDIGWHAYNVDASKLSPSERRFFDGITKEMKADGAYAMVQMSMPRSLAVGLTDSPVGLAAWILDRFHSWSDGDLEKDFGRDELITDIMLYWVTQTIDSSVFNYCAEARSPSLTPEDHVDVPVAMALFPQDLGGIPSRPFAERTLNIKRWTTMPHGGHFAALEQPDLYANDISAFFKSLAV